MCLNILLFSVNNNSDSKIDNNNCNNSYYYKEKNDKINDNFNN